MQQIFEQAESARSLKELNKIFDVYPELKTLIKTFEEKYPRIDLQFSLEELAQLEESGTISKEYLTVNSDKTNNFSPFEKLLLAVLWKNGHLTRVRPILQGMLGKEFSDSGYGAIFRQFGRSLVDDTEPIVDQHVLRAFCTYKDLSSIQGRKMIPRKSVVKDSDQEIINAYRNWSKLILSGVKTAEQPEFKYRIDKILFWIGKNLSEQASS